MTVIGKLVSETLNEDKNIMIAIVLQKEVPVLVRQYQQARFSQDENGIALWPLATLPNSDTDYNTNHRPRPVVL